VTRALLTAALDGSLRNCGIPHRQVLRLRGPDRIAGRAERDSQSVNTWKDKAEFDKTARALVAMFQKNFAKFEAKVDADVRAAAPRSSSRRSEAGSVIPGRVGNASLES